MDIEVLYDCTARDGNVASCPELTWTMTEVTFPLDGSDVVLRAVPEAEVPIDVELAVQEAISDPAERAPAVGVGWGWIVPRAGRFAIPRPDSVHRTPERPDCQELVRYEGRWELRVGLSRTPTITLHTAESEGVTCCDVRTYDGSHAWMEPRCLSYPEAR